MNQIETPVVSCSWCGTRYTTLKSNCSNCGGPISAPPSEGAGSLPPAAPRELPAGYMYMKDDPEHNTIYPPVK